MSYGGILGGRPPYDTRNLLSAGAQDIAFSPDLGATRLVQYTLAGYVEGRDERIDGLMFKGQLAIVPDEEWPLQFPDQSIVMASRDCKLNSAWSSGSEKQAWQDAPDAAALMLHGCLVVKQERTRLVGVPKDALARLGGDYDGDELQVLPAARFPTLAAHVNRLNARSTLGNPKVDKTFTPGGDVDDMQTYVQLQGRLIERSNLASLRLQALPGPERDRIALEMRAGSILPAVYGSPGRDWFQAAGLGDRTAFDALSPAKQARRLMKREVEVIARHATDMEKSSIDYRLVSDRCRQYLERVGTGGMPYGKGFHRQLKKLRAGELFDPRTGGAMTLETLLRQRLDSTRHFTGLPNAVFADLIAWQLARMAPGSAAPALAAPETRDT
ncbi:MAG: hypothetical protein EOO24_09315 [Comamonadaceae bacterium]|nr:MAG: hypothetical protein EOO24_09315 [Comamonadaceae bacterium]